MEKRRVTGFTFGNTPAKALLPIDCSTFGSQLKPVKLMHDSKASSAMVSTLGMLMVVSYWLLENADLPMLTKLGALSTVSFELEKACSRISVTCDGISKVELAKPSNA